MTCPCCAGGVEWDPFDLCDDCLSAAFSDPVDDHSGIHPLSDAQKAVQR